MDEHERIEPPEPAVLLPQSCRLPKGVAIEGTRIRFGEAPRESTRVPWWAIYGLLGCLWLILDGPSWMFFIGFVGLGVVAAVPMLGGTRRGLTVDARGLRVGGWRHYWRELGALSLIGRGPGAVGLYDRHHRLYFTWHPLEWGMVGTITDFEQLARRMEEVTGRRVELRLSARHAWTARTKRLRERAAGAAFWESLYVGAVFAEFLAVPAVEPPGVVGLDGWSVHLETDLPVDLRSGGVSIGARHWDWRHVDGARCAYRVSDGDVVEARVELHTRFGGVPLCRWASIEDDTGPTARAGHLNWLVERIETLRTEVDVRPRVEGRQPEAIDNLLASVTR